MDIKIENKDIAVNENGRVIRIEGLEEYLQRALISLSAKRGAFPYNRELGTHVPLNSVTEPLKLLKEAEAAVASDPQLNIKAAKIEGNIRIFTVETPFGTGEIRL